MDRKSAYLTKSESTETASITSEPSLAIVSLYNSWSTCGSSTDTLLGDSDLTDVAIMEPDELLNCLKKRCRSEDLPPVPHLRTRKRPNCVFLNYMGSRVSTEAPSVSKENDVFPELEFDFGKDDPLYPVVSESDKFAFLEKGAFPADTMDALSRERLVTGEQTDNRKDSS